MSNECTCYKEPFKVFGIDSLRGMIHTDCGKKIRLYATEETARTCTHFSLGKIRGICVYCDPACNFPIR